MYSSLALGGRHKSAAPQATPREAKHGCEQQHRPAQATPPWSLGNCGLLGRLYDVNASETLKCQRDSDLSTIPPVCIDTITSKCALQSCIDLTLWTGCLVHGCCSACWLHFDFGLGGHIEIRPPCPWPLDDCIVSISVASRSCWHEGQVESAMREVEDVRNHLPMNLLCRWVRQAAPSALDRCVFSQEHVWTHTSDFCPIPCFVCLGFVLPHYPADLRLLKPPELLEDARRTQATCLREQRIDM
mmetsp:Transcript_15731/g.36170  ORF Transcript_15731/g.36170 Transcript_15731/m.36170 type:complete len:244 (+) Transcript_15731:637-1368(+)